MAPKYAISGTDPFSKLIYLALRRITKKWKKPPMHWAAAALQFAIQFGNRFKKQ